MSKIFSNIVKFTLFFSIGIFLFWITYKDQNATELLETVQHKVNYWWILLSLTFGLLSHISRTIRWNLLIQPLGKTPRFINTFLAVMVGYFANLALPRMGEISRCGIISRYEKLPFSKVFGTVVLERILDILMLLVFLIITLTTQYGIITDFFSNNPGVSNKLSTIFASSYTLYVIISLIIIFLLLKKHFKETRLFQKINQLVADFGDGFKTVKNLNNKWAFIGHTIFIWIMYYLMIYVCFFSFGFTSNLPAIAGLTVFVMGSLGMVAPVQGGIGAWHFMVIGTLILYLPHIINIRNLAGSFALVVHGSQTLMIIIMGTLSVIALPFINRKKRH